MRFREQQTPLRERAEAALDRLGAPGAAVALFTDDGPLLHAQLGHADLHHQRELEAGARFPVYSITKTLIAAALLALVDEGHVHLDVAVDTSLPGLDLPEPVTVRQLLNHTAGLPDYGGLPAYQESLRAHPRQPWSSDEFLARTIGDGLGFPARTRWAYSNIGYLILRLLLERVTGQPLNQALQTRLFAPLGLLHTGVAETLEDTRTLTPGFSAFWSGGELQDVRPLYHPGWVAHGLVTSTATELAQLCHAVFTGRFFSKSLLNEMLTPIIVGGQHPVFHLPAYGLGVMLDGETPDGVVGHGGGGPGYSAGALHFRSLAGRALTSVALVNLDRDDAGVNLAAEVARGWLDREAQGGP